MNERIAVVGSGVSGLVSALLLAQRGKKVTLIESDSRLGGHAFTYDLSNKNLPNVDLGFQVYNLTTYPILTRLFDELEIETEPSDMSFSLSTEKNEWASHNLNSVFATRSNIISSEFLGMLKEVFRFAKEAKNDLPTLSENMSLGEYLKVNKYSDVFSKDYLVPMTAAVWSVPYKKMLEYPAKAMIGFWNNHHLLNPLGERPRWRVVSGRSDTYVKGVEQALLKLGATIKTSTKCMSCSERTENGLKLKYETGEEEFFSQVVFATHSDVTLSILGNEATAEEKKLLGAIEYEPNRVILHSDENLMPRSKTAWASWNVLQRTNQSDELGVCVTYWLNRLQNLPEGTRTLLCTLNPIVPISPESILLDITLAHPVFNAAALEAQRILVNKQQTNNNSNVWFAGAWLGNGFHEDGARSALQVVESICPAIEKVWSLDERGPSPENGNFLERFGIQVFDYIANEAIKKGYLKIVLPSGDEIGPFGRKSRKEALELKEPVCELRVRDVSMFWRLIQDSDIGLGEAYMERLFDLPKGHEDLVGLFDLLLDNRQRFAQVLGMESVVASPLKLLASGLYKFGNVIQAIRHARRNNTVEGSKKNIHEHYDLGNDFYKLFLDETMSYSSGIHATPEVSLKDAQIAKYDRIIAKALLNNTSHVLEIGCGWGGFAARAIETTGCRVTGVTISIEQLNYAVERMKTAGYSDRANLIFCDYRNIPTTFEKRSFDAVVSIEMLEAVGHEHLPTYFSIVDQMLKPQGLAVIQVIGMPNDRYEEYLSSSDFIRRHIFPGGHLPCMNALLNSLVNTTLTMEEEFDIGPDYASSLLEWRNRFFAKRKELKSMGFDDVFIRKWLFYFAYCEIGFRKKYIYDWQIVFMNNGTLAEANKKRSLTAVPTTTTTKTPITVSNTPIVNTSSIDFITGAFFGAWLVLCGLVVAEKGQHLLMIPFMLMASVSLHLTMGYGSWYKYEHGAMISSLVAFIVCLVVDAETAVLVGSGLCAGDLFSLVWTGAFAPRMIRVIFMALEVSYFGIASFYGPVGNPILHSIMTSHLLTSSVLNLSIHANFLQENSKLIQVSLVMSLLAVTFTHIQSYLSSESSSLGSFFTGSALIYDLICLLGIGSSLTKKKVD